MNHSEYRFFVYDNIVANGSSYIVYLQYNVDYEVPISVMKEAEKMLHTRSLLIK